VIDDFGVGRPFIGEPPRLRADTER